jgi:hypothetical protein
MLDLPWFIPLNRLASKNKQPPPGSSALLPQHRVSDTTRMK